MRLLALFRATFRLTRWLRRRITPAGLAIAALALFSAAFGLDTEGNAAHQAFALSGALLAVDLVALLLQPSSRRPRLSATRELPRFISADSDTRYRLRVRNDGDARLPPLELAERLAQPWPDAAIPRRYPRFVALLRRLRAVETDPIALPALLPGQAVALDVPLRATARGLAGFEQLEAVVTGPLGLIARRVSVDVLPAVLPVLPQRHQVELPPPAGRRHWQPGGIALAQHVGDSEEFRALRDYRPGDPLRSIHWRSFARIGKPLVREYQEEFFARHALVLDTALPAVAEERFELAVSIAAGLVAAPREADSLLDLLFVGDRVHRLTAGRGLGSADGLLRVLAGVRPGHPATFPALLSTALRHAPQASSMVVVLLAWDDERRAAIRSLRAAGPQLTVFVVGEAPTDGADAATHFVMPGSAAPVVA